MKSIALCLLLALGAPAAAQVAPQPRPPAGPWDPADRLAAQREAMQALAFLDGAWRGPARAAGVEDELVQTERVGTLLDGSVRLVEGRGYDPSGATVFNAFAVISYDPALRNYMIRSYAGSYAGDYPLTVLPDGFSWSHPAGPGATIRYTATVQGGEWHEVGERIADGAEPVRVVELRLRRVDTSDWPEGGAVPTR